MGKDPKPFNLYMFRGNNPISKIHQVKEYVTGNIYNVKALHFNWFLLNFCRPVNCSTFFNNLNSDTFNNQALCLSFYVTFRHTQLLYAGTQKIKNINFYLLIIFALPSQNRRVTFNSVWCEDIMIRPQWAIKE